jgi:hypothetical protein
MFEGVKSFCTIDAFKILYDELWFTYLKDFEEKNNGIRILPTPFTYTIVDLNNTIREKNVRSNEMNPVEKINSITRIAGVDNQSIGIDNNSYIEVLPHCETTAKIQTYMRIVKRLCKGLKSDISNLTDEDRDKLVKANIHSYNLSKKVYEEIKVIWDDRLNRNLPSKIIDPVHTINFKLNTGDNVMEFVPSEESNNEDQVIALIDRYGNDCSAAKLTSSKSSFKFEASFIDIFNKPRGRRWELKNSQKTKFSTKIQRRYHSTKISYSNQQVIEKYNKVLNKFNSPRIWEKPVLFNNNEIIKSCNNDFYSIWSFRSVGNNTKSLNNLMNDTTQFLNSQVIYMTRDNMTKLMKLLKKTDSNKVNDTGILQIKR